MENEIRYYLKQILACMGIATEDLNAESVGSPKFFEPAYLITAVQLPTGAIEVAINNSNIKEKINYILEAYDDDMHLKTNPSIVLKNIMIV